MTDQLMVPDDVERWTTVLADGTRQPFPGFVRVADGEDGLGIYAEGVTVGDDVVPWYDVENYAGTDYDPPEDEEPAA